MDSLFPAYLFPIEGIAYSDDALAPAGVFLLGGRSFVAPLHSAAERRLVAAGALRVATLRFDPDPSERSHSDRPLTALPAADAARHYAASVSGN